MLHLSNRHRLRKATASAHSSLEAAVGQITDLRSYGWYLRGLAAFRVAAEAGLRAHPWPVHFGAWRPTELSAELLLDVADLSGEPLPQGHVRVEDDLGSVFGVLYVLEGSTLGAQVLMPTALQLGLSGASGARHLVKQASATKNWRDFVVLLDNAASVEVAAVVDVANATFEAARDCMLRARDAGR
jgi:heme oxygenase